MLVKNNLVEYKSINDFYENNFEKNGFLIIKSYQKKNINDLKKLILQMIIHTKNLKTT